MTDTTEQKALAEVNAAHPHTHWNDIRDVGQGPLIKTLCRTIECEEAFRQEVSDAVHKHWGDMPCEFDRFIIAKPDPLVEVWEEAMAADQWTEDRLQVFRAAVEKRGGKIVWGEG